MFKTSRTSRPSNSHVGKLEGSGKGARRGAALPLYSYLPVRYYAVHFCLRAFGCSPASDFRPSWPKLLAIL